MAGDEVVEEDDKTGGVGVVVGGSVQPQWSGHHSKTGKSKEVLVRPLCHFILSGAEGLCSPSIVPIGQNEMWRNPHSDF